MIKTAPVLCGAYLKGDRRQTFLTHLVETEPETGSGWPRPFCKRVAAEGSVTDDSTQHTDDRPTCKDCARKWDKLNNQPKYPIR